MENPWGGGGGVQMKEPSVGRMDIYFISWSNRFSISGQQSISRTITSKELTLKQILQQSMAHNYTLNSWPVKALDPETEIREMENKQ